MERPELLSSVLPVRARVSVSVAPGALALAVATPRGSATWRRYRVRLAGDDVHPGIATSNVRAPRAVAFALRGLWKEASLRNRRVEIVSLIVPDQAVRMAVVPLEGREPGAAEGDAMARWALRDLFCIDEDECRVDWAVLSNESTPAAKNWLFALAAATDVVREYEEIVESLGLTVGRLVPMSMALAAGMEHVPLPGPTVARLLLCETGGLLSGLVEADGVPRLHRAWRRLPDDLAADLRSIDRYLQQRQGLIIAEAAVAGPRRWRAEAVRTCEALGWRTTLVSRWTAHRGAIR